MAIDRSSAGESGGLSNCVEFNVTERCVGTGVRGGKAGGDSSKRDQETLKVPGTMPGRFAFGTCIGRR